MAEHIVALLLHGLLARATTDRDDAIALLRTTVDTIIDEDLLGDAR